MASKAELYVGGISRVNFFKRLFNGLFTKDNMIKCFESAYVSGETAGKKSCENDINVANARIKELTSKVSELEGKIETGKTEVQMLQSKLATSENSSKAKDGTIAELQHTLNELNKVPTAAVDITPVCDMPEPGKRMFSCEQIKAIRKKAADKVTPETLSEEYKCSKTTILNIINGKTYKDC